MRMEEEKRKEDEIFDRLCSPGGMRRKEMDGVSSLMRYHREKRDKGNETRDEFEMGETYR